MPHVHAYIQTCTAWYLHNHMDVPAGLELHIRICQRSIPMAYMIIWLLS